MVTLLWAMIFLLLNPLKINWVITSKWWWRWKKTTRLLKFRLTAGNPLLSLHSDSQGRATQIQCLKKQDPFLTKEAVKSCSRAPKSRKGWKIGATNAVSPVHMSVIPKLSSILLMNTTLLQDVCYPWSLYQCDFSQNRDSDAHRHQSCLISF